MSLNSFEFENLFEDELPIPGNGLISNGMNKDLGMTSFEFEDIFEDELPIPRSKTIATSRHDLSNGMNKELDMTSFEFEDIFEDEFPIPRSKTLDNTRHDLSNSMNQELDMTSFEFEDIFEDELPIPRSKTMDNSRHDLSNGMANENDSRSESENVEQGSGGSGYNIKHEAKSPCKKQLQQPAVRHSDQQIKKLKELFKIYPHADEKQRKEIGKQIGLKSCQVNSWFQNHRVKVKARTKRYENALLRQENNKLHAENKVLKGTSPICNRCYGPTALRVIWTDQQQRLWIENARLNEEIGRVRAIVQEFLGMPVSSLAARPVTPPCTFGLVGDIALPVLPDSIPPPVDMSPETFMFRGLASSNALEELLKMALKDEPLWVPSSEGGGSSSSSSSSKATLNYEAYLRDFTRLVGQKPVGYVSDVSEEFWDGYDQKLGPC